MGKCLMVLYLKFVSRASIHLSLGNPISTKVAILDSMVVANSGKSSSIEIMTLFVSPSLLESVKDDIVKI